jgi:hypothetical protein
VQLLAPSEPGSPKTSIFLTRKEHFFFQTSQVRHRRPNNRILHLGSLVGPTNGPHSLIWQHIPTFPPLLLLPSSTLHASHPSRLIHHQPPSLTLHPLLLYFLFFSFFRSLNPIYIFSASSFSWGQFSAVLCKCTAVLTKQVHCSSLQHAVLWLFVLVRCAMPSALLLFLPIHQINPISLAIYICISLH